MNTKLQPTVTSNKPLISVAQPLDIVSEGCPCGRSAEQALVVHCKHNKYDVYIGRPSKWGNPFVIGKDGDRNTVIRKYEAYLRNSPVLLAQLHELKGKVLGCWCAPCACHGHVLVWWANYDQFNAEDAYWHDFMKDVELPHWGGVR